jgi:hypothetical protein
MPLRETEPIWNLGPIPSLIARSGTPSKSGFRRGQAWLEFLGPHFRDHRKTQKKTGQMYCLRIAALPLEIASHKDGQKFTEVLRSLARMHIFSHHIAKWRNVDFRYPSRFSGWVRLLPYLLKRHKSDYKCFHAMTPALPSDKFVLQKISYGKNHHPLYHRNSWAAAFGIDLTLFLTRWKKKRFNPFTSASSQYVDEWGGIYLPKKLH